MAYLMEVTASSTGFSSGRFLAIKEPLANALDRRLGSMGDLAILRLGAPELRLRLNHCWTCLLYKCPEDSIKHHAVGSLVLLAAITTGSTAITLTGPVPELDESVLRLRPEATRTILSMTPEHGLPLQQIFMTTEQL